MFGSHISKLCATKCALRLSVVKPRLIDNQSEKGKSHKEPMRSKIQNKQTIWSAGKREWPCLDWFSFGSDWLKKVARVVWTSHAARKSKTKAIPNYFWHPTETISKRSSIFTEFERKWLLGFCIPHSWLPNRGLTGHHKPKTESVSVEASASWSSPLLASSSQQDKQHQQHQWLQYHYHHHHHH